MPPKKECLNRGSNILFPLPSENLSLIYQIRQVEGTNTLYCLLHSFHEYSVQTYLSVAAKEIKQTRLEKQDQFAGNSNKRTFNFKIKFRSGNAPRLNLPFRYICESVCIENVLASNGKKNWSFKSNFIHDFWKSNQWNRKRLSPADSLLNDWGAFSFPRVPPRKKTPFQHLLCAILTRFIHYSKCVKRITKDEADNVKNRYSFPRYYMKEL